MQARRTPELAEGSVSPDLPAFSWRSTPDRPQSPRDRQHGAQRVLPGAFAPTLPAASRGSVRFPRSLKGAAQMPPFQKSQMCCHSLFGILKANFKASVMFCFVFPCWS